MLEKRTKISVDDVYMSEFILSTLREKMSIDDIVLSCVLREAL